MEEEDPPWPDSSIDPLQKLRELSLGPPTGQSTRGLHERACEDWRTLIAELIAGPLDDPNTAHEVYQYDDPADQQTIKVICRIARRVVIEHDVKSLYPRTPSAPSQSLEERVAEIQRATQIEVAKIHAEGATAAAKFQSDATETAARLHGEATKSAARWGMVGGVLSGTAISALISWLIARGCR